MSQLAIGSSGTFRSEELALRTWQQCFFNLFFISEGI